jgi:hypothetical protein
MVSTTLYTGTSGGIFKSTDGAGNWSAVNTGLPTCRSVSALVIIIGETHDREAVRAARGAPEIRDSVVQWIGFDGRASTPAAPTARLNTLVGRESGRALGKLALRARPRKEPGADLPELERRVDGLDGLDGVERSVSAPVDQGAPKRREAPRKRVDSRPHLAESGLIGRRLRREGANRAFVRPLALGQDRPLADRNRPSTQSGRAGTATPLWGSAVPTGVTPPR